MWFYSRHLDGDSYRGQQVLILNYLSRVSWSHHHSLGSRYSDGLSWSSLQKDPSCWGKARWRSMQRICGCRYCWIDGGTRACGSVMDRDEQRVSNKLAKLWQVIIHDQIVGLPLTTSSSSTSTMSYALRAPQKMIQVTPSKQWIHFFLSDLWPPTSNILFTTESWKKVSWAVTSCSFSPGSDIQDPPATYLKCSSLQENCSSMIPVVLTRDRSTSCSVGR